MSDDGMLIVQVHHNGKGDRTAAHMITDAELAHYQRMEAEALYLRKVVQAVRLAIVSDFSPENCSAKTIEE